jgi:Phosphotransferase enzyme family
VTVFRALVVDDDEWVRDKAVGASNPSDGIEVLTAGNKEDAGQIIAENFLHVAVVDLELQKVPRNLGEGKTVLRSLMAARPSCRRVLLTKYATTFPEGVFEMLKPDDPVVYGAIDKEELSSEYFHRYVGAMAASWRRAPVRIENAEEIFALVGDKSVRTEMVMGKWKVAITLDELEYVLASVFGQRFRAANDPPDPDDVESVTLTPFRGGKSRSIVLHGRPVDRLGGSGLLCVIKVGPRAEAEQELQRYQQYVRYRMALTRRVEVLGRALGDTLGVIAYSFAGPGDENVDDLQTLLDAGDARALKHLDALYGNDRAWGPDCKNGDDLGEFFSEAYKLRPRKVREYIGNFADELESSYGWNHRHGQLLLPGGKLSLPTDEIMGSGLLRMDYVTTIVHGDLNASNVIVGDGDRHILIDYRHTARGPRTLDYASMHASIRLSEAAYECSPDAAVQDEAAEYRLWQHDWKSDADWWPPESPGEPPFWLKTAARLMALTTWHLPDVSRAEHAATCWLYAMRVFRVRDIDKDARLRLLIWLSALDRVLADEARR